MPFSSAWISLESRSSPRLSLRSGDEVAEVGDERDQGVQASLHVFGRE